MAGIRIPVGEAEEIIPRRRAPQSVASVDAKLARVPTLPMSQAVPSSIPMGEARHLTPEHIPVGEAKELPKSSLRAPASTIPSLPATAPADPFPPKPPSLPVGQATEFKTLPVGEATEIERIDKTRNLSVGKGTARVSPEAKAWNTARGAAPTGPTGPATGGMSPGLRQVAVPEPMKVPSALDAGVRKITDFANTPTGSKVLGAASMAGRVAGAAGTAYSGVRAASDLSAGRTSEGLQHGLDAAGGVMMAAGGPVGQVLGGGILAGGLAGQGIAKYMPSTSDAIGSVVHKGLRAVGLGGDVYEGPQPSYMDDGLDHAPGEAGGGRGFVNPPPIATDMRTNGLPGNRSLPSTGAGGGRGFTNPAAVNPAAPLAAPGATLPGQGDIVKSVDARGRVTYTGQGDVGAGARIVDPMGRGSQGGSVNSMPAAAFTGGPTGLREALAGNPVSYSGAGAAEAQAPAPMASFQSSTRGNMRSSNEALDPMDEIQSRGLNARGAGLLMQARNQAMGNETSRRGQDISAASAAANNETQRRGQELGASTTMRGQDISAATSIRGQDMSNQLARTQAALQRESNMRQYQLEAEKFGHEKAKTLHAQREAGQKDFQTWAENQFIDEDGKADKAKAADFSMAATASLGGLITRLEQAGQKDKADKLRAEGFAGLDMEDRALLRTLYERRAAHAGDLSTGAGKVLNPFSASGSTGNDLFDFMITGTDKGLVQQRYKLAGGQSVGRNTLDYAGGANAVTGLFKNQSTALQPTLRERQLLEAQLAKQNIRSN